MGASLHHHNKARSGILRKIGFLLVKGCPEGELDKEPWLVEKAFRHEWQDSVPSASQKKIPHPLMPMLAIESGAESKVESILAQRGMVALTPRTITTTEQLKEDLARIRANGYAVDDIENETGVRCVGAPIFNHQREVIAALSISGPADRIPLARIERVGEELANAARAISERLGYRDQCGLHNN